MPHPDEGLIHAWLDDELDATEAARVESLVASDPAWQAAAAEARGLIAATARIVGALDHVPANVIPKLRPSRGVARQWMWRAAAALVLVAGSAVVLERQTPELAIRGGKGDSKTAPAAPPVAQEQKKAPARKLVDAPVAAAPSSGDARREIAGSTQPAKRRSDLQKQELDEVKKQTKLARDKDAPVTSTDTLRANTAGAINRAAAQRAASGGASLPAAPFAQRAAAAEKTAAAPLGCFEQREPPDSAKRIIRLGAVDLADSVRLEKLTVRGDTIAAVHGRLIAVRVRCP